MNAAVKSWSQLFVCVVKSGRQNSGDEEKPESHGGNSNPHCWLFFELATLGPRWKRWLMSSAMTRSFGSMGLEVKQRRRANIAPPCRTRFFFTLPKTGVPTRYDAAKTALNNHLVQNKKMQHSHGTHCTASPLTHRESMGKTTCWIHWARSKGKL